jgi:Sas10/Utp3/C1D family
MASGPEEARLEASLINLEKNLKKISAEIMLLRKKGKLEDLMKELSALENARMNSCLSYTLISLYKVYMKVSGVDESEHGIFKEIDRNRKLLQQVKEAEAKQSAAELGEKREMPSQSETAEDQGGAKRLKVDTEATARMFKSHLGPDGRLLNEVDLKKAGIAGAAVNRKDIRKVNKGSVLPTQNHLSWKQALEQMQK